MAIIDNFTAQSAVGNGISFRPLRPSLTFDVHTITLESRAPSIMMNDFIDTLSRVIEES
jgi:hypothetical protein